MQGAQVPQPFMGIKEALLFEARYPHRSDCKCPECETGIRPGLAEGESVESELEQARR